MFIFEDDGLGSEFKPLEQLNLLSEVAGLDQASMVYAWSQGNGKNFLPNILPLKINKKILKHN